MSENVEMSRFYVHMDHEFTFQFFRPFLCLIGNTMEWFDRANE